MLSGIPLFDFAVNTTVYSFSSGSSILNEAVISVTREVPLSTVSSLHSSSTGSPLTVAVISAIPVTDSLTLTETVPLP